MCGIVAYLGQKQAFPVVVNGLKRLEYRGYDSSGISVLHNGEVLNHKKKGKVTEMETTCPEEFKSVSVGIGHTRWATHGIPSDRNAHPHLSEDGAMSIVHNGIIENFDSIKQELVNRGYTFRSDTDTEVLAYLISDILKNEEVTLFQAVRLALTQVVGAYAIVVMHKDYPNILVAARKGSPLVIGIGEDEYYLASDATPIVEFTKDVVYLEEEEIAEVSLETGLNIKTLNNKEISPFVQKIEMELEAIEKGGYEHFMLKEIFEQPRAVADCLRGRLLSKKGLITMRGLQEHANTFKNADRLIIIACGTSWHAGLVAEYFIETLARVPVEVEYASEFRYRDPIITPKDIVIAVSQSGETADTLAALKMAKERGATIFGICNVVGSSISRLTDAGAYTHAGPEIGVASTKAFTSQLAVLNLLGLAIANEKGSITTSRFHRLMLELEELPNKIERILAKADESKVIADAVKDSSNALFLGRGINFPIALEGALKLKEISYIHAEGYPAAEMKHGPIALIDEHMPVFVVANKGTSYKKVLSNIQEVKARKGKVIAVVTEGDTQVKELADFVFEVPETDELLTPLLTVIPLQLISYYIAVYRGCNVDQPRNLAKSVTVE
jgi:glucosamine--fructose-6-phosphate aminotransferase (isomerizing)